MSEIIIVGLTAGLIMFFILFVFAFIALSIVTLSVRFITGLFRRLTCENGTICQEQAA